MREEHVAWNFELVAGPFKGRTGGLAWDGSGMLFSAVHEERVMRFDPGSRKASLFRWRSGRTNGIAIASDGSVYGAQEGGRRVIHFLKDGSTAATCELLEGKHHNQPTDVVVDRKGRVWIADPYNATPPYGPPVFPFLEHASVLRLQRDAAGRWSLTRITRDTHGPRAIALSRDERTLYVADGDAERGDMCQLLAYPIEPEGSVGARKSLLAFASAERGIEGLCLDSEGNLIACAGWSRGGMGPMLHVISPSGTLIESHPAPADMPMRCAFGDADLASLYVTAGDGGLYRASATGRRGCPR
jgi:gluconolactonase